MTVLQSALGTYFMEQSYTSVSGHPVDNDLGQVYRLPRRTERTTARLPAEDHVANLWLISIYSFICEKDTILLWSLALGFGLQLLSRHSLACRFHRRSLYPCSLWYSTHGIRS